MSVLIYWSWFFPVYKLSRIQTFLCCIFSLFFTTPKTIRNPFALKHCPQRKPFKTLGNTSLSNALLRMLERCLSIYTGPDSFPYTNFPVLHFFCNSLRPQKKFLTPFALKHCPQRKPFKTLGNTSPSKALLRMLERCLSIYTGPDSFPYTNFPVYKLSPVAFFSSFFTTPKTNLNPFCSQALSPKKTL